MTKLGTNEKEAIIQFLTWLYEKYEVVEREDDGYVLCGDLVYKYDDELLEEYFKECEEEK